MGRAVDVRVVVSSCSVTAVEVVSGDTTLLLLMLPGVVSIESRLEEGSRVISGLEETRDSWVLTVNSEVVTMPVCVGEGITVSVMVETVLVVTDTT